MNTKSTTAKSVPLKKENFEKLKEYKTICETNANMAKLFCVKYHTMSRLLETGRSSVDTIRIVNDKLKALEGVDIWELVFGELV